MILINFLKLLGENIIFNTCKIVFVIAAIFLSKILVDNAKKKYKKIKEKYNLYEPETNYEFFRDIPSDLDPIFASELVFMKDPFDENKEKQEEYAAVLCNSQRTDRLSRRPAFSYQQIRR